MGEGKEDEAEKETRGEIADRERERLDEGTFLGSLGEYGECG